jgi:hypothetical protein
MSDINFSGVDFGFAFDENFNRDLAAYFQTPEGQANLAASGLGGIDIPDAAVPETDSIVYAGGTPRSVFDGSEPVQGIGFAGGETVEERIARLDREQRDASEAASALARTRELDFARESRQKNARDTIAETLAIYGLSDLADYTYSEIIAKDITDPAAIIFKLRDQPAYQKRFGANAARLKAGLPELSPAEYIDLEDMYRTVIRSNGLPAGFYDSEDDTRKLLEGSVSPDEFQRRIRDGYNAVANADPEVKRQFKDFYGVTDNELAAYFLDPSRGETILTTRARAAQIAARGKEQGGIRLTGAFAEDLAARGITEQQARAGFAEVGALGELRQTFAGETELSGERLAGAAFGIDVAAQQELERKRRLRTGEFAGGGSFARTTGETSGSISTAVGRAQ